MTGGRGQLAICVFVLLLFDVEKNRDGDVGCWPGMELVTTALSMMNGETQKKPVHYYYLL